MTITANFPGCCHRCGHRYPAGTRIEWTRGMPSTHATPADCLAAASAVTTRAAEPTVTIEAKGIVDFLRAARDRGLLYPKARFLAADGRGELRLSIAGPTSAKPGSVQVLVNGLWVGRIEPTGAVVGRLASDARQLATLRTIAGDPATAAAAYGRLMGFCSFCHHKLTDDRSGSSVELGYGPDCADRWGLPHHPTGARKVLAPVPVDVEMAALNLVVAELRATRTRQIDLDEMDPDCE